MRGDLLSACGTSGPDLAGVAAINTGTENRYDFPVHSTTRAQGPRSASYARPRTTRIPEAANATTRHQVASLGTLHRRDRHASPVSPAHFPPVLLPGKPLGWKQILERITVANPAVWASSTLGGRRGEGCKVAASWFLAVTTSGTQGRADTGKHNK